MTLQLLGNYEEVTMVSQGQELNWLLYANSLILTYLTTWKQENVQIQSHIFFNI